VSYYTTEELMVQLKHRAEVPVGKQLRQNYVKNTLDIDDELTMNQRLRIQAESFDLLAVFPELRFGFQMVRHGVRPVASII